MLRFQILLNDQSDLRCFNRFKSKFFKMNLIYELLCLTFDLQISECSACWEEGLQEPSIVQGKQKRQRWSFRSSQHFHPQSVSSATHGGPHCQSFQVKIILGMGFLLVTWFFSLDKLYFYQTDTVKNIYLLVDNEFYKLL